MGSPAVWPNAFRKIFPERVDPHAPGTGEAYPNEFPKGDEQRRRFFHERGEIRDGSFESQAFRASGLNLVVSAIVLWNTARTVEPEHQATVEIEPQRPPIHFTRRYASPSSGNRRVRQRRPQN